MAMESAAADPSEPTTAEVLITCIDGALHAERWKPAEVRIAPPGITAVAWTAPDRTVHLMVTCATGEPLTADLTGHPAGHPATAIWSFSITDPTEQQLLASARAAADHRLREVVNFAARLERAGWTLRLDDKPPETLCQITSADERLTLTRHSGDKHQPGGWTLTGDGLRADATDDTPTAVLAALITRGPVPTSTATEPEATPAQQ